MACTSSLLMDSSPGRSVGGGENRQFVFVEVRAGTRWADAVQTGSNTIHHTFGVAVL